MQYVVTERFIFTLFCTIFAFLGATHEVSAQMSSSVVQASQITLSPQSPAPNSSATAHIDAYAMDTTGATITWYIDGEEVPSAKNARSMNFTAGALGDTLSIRAVISPIGFPSFTVEKRVTPTAIDVIVEAATYVPSFYLGRPLPSGDASVRVVAIPHVGDGANLSSFTYKWELNGGVLQGGAVKGKNSIILNVPRYTGGTVSVTVTDSSGELIGTKTVSLEAMRPEIRFYEKNPLRGFQEQAITERLNLIADETTIHAEPYFMNTEYGSTRANFEWDINGTRVPATDHKENVITLKKTGAGGTAGVSVQAVTTGAIPQFTQGSFMILF